MPGVATPLSGISAGRAVVLPCLGAVVPVAGWLLVAVRVAWVSAAGGVE
jgi:hypothetical protein